MTAPTIRPRESKRYIGLTEEGRVFLAKHLDDINSELPAETVQIIRDSMHRFFREQASDHYSI